MRLGRTDGIVKLTETQLADPQQVGVKRGPEGYILCRDSEIECQLDSAESKDIEAPSRFIRPYALL